MWILLGNKNGSILPASVGWDLGAITANFVFDPFSIIQIPMRSFQLK
jgi:hypothetical protein